MLTNCYFGVDVFHVTTHFHLALPEASNGQHPGCQCTQTGSWCHNLIEDNFKGYHQSCEFSAVLLLACSPPNPHLVASPITSKCFSIHCGWCNTTPEIFRGQTDAGRPWRMVTKPDAKSPQSADSS